MSVQVCTYKCVHAHTPMYMHGGQKKLLGVLYHSASIPGAVIFLCALIPEPETRFSARLEDGKPQRALPLPLRLGAEVTGVCRVGWGVECELLSSGLWPTHSS